MALKKDIARENETEDIRKKKFCRNYDNRGKMQAI